MAKDKSSVLIIYTGGTIGMMENSMGQLSPVDFDRLLEHLPDISRLQSKIENIQFDPPVDSSDIDHQGWIRMVKVIEENYDKYDGFVILHGTDTMAYTASALSFMIENPTKPIILTGSQLPIGRIRTDGKENFLTALEIAASCGEDSSNPISEVCIFFQNDLMRGNRTSKWNAENFSAFRSFNYPLLARAGVHIRYEDTALRKPNQGGTKFHYDIESNVVILRIFPGISYEMVRAIIDIPNLKGVVLETYGSGNVPNYTWFLETMQHAVQKGIIIVSVTQCAAGGVELGRYAAGNVLLEAGIVSGHNMTTEAAVTKLMFLLGQKLPYEEVKRQMSISIAGELDNV